MRENLFVRVAVIWAAWAVVAAIAVMFLSIGYFMMAFFLFHLTMNLAVFSRRLMAILIGQALATRNEEAYARVRRTLHFRVYAVTTNAFFLGAAVYVIVHTNFSLLQLLRAASQ